MSLCVDAYIIDEAGKMVIVEAEAVHLTLAGFESYRTKMYGSEAAIRLGLVLLPTLATSNLFVLGGEVAQLRAEAELILENLESFAEQTNLNTEDVQRRIDNVRLACLRAEAVNGNVVIW